MTSVYRLEDSHFQFPSGLTPNQQKDIDIRTDLGLLPRYEYEDYYPSSATGVNKGLDFNVMYDNIANEETARIEESLFRKEYYSMGIRGNKVLPGKALDISYDHVGGREEETRFTIPHMHYINEEASARHGLHGVVGEARTTLARQQLITQGGNKSGRHVAFEKEVNPKIYPELATGLPLSVEPNRPTLDVENINKQLMNPVAVFPGGGVF